MFFGRWDVVVKTMMGVMGEDDGWLFGGLTFVYQRELLIGAFHGLPCKVNNIIIIIIKYGLYNFGTEVYKL